MRPLVIVVSSLVGLTLLASTASAKELAGASVCGADGCRSARDAQLRGLEPEGDAEVAPTPAPFLRVTLRFRGEEDEIVTVRSLLIPSTGAFGGEGGWLRLRPASLEALQRVGEGLEPLPAAQLSDAVQELGGAPLEEATPPPPEDVAPPPVDRSSPTGVVVGLGAIIVLLGVVAVVRERRHPGGGALAG
jgi:hypothetical protein